MQFNNITFRIIARRMRLMLVMSVLALTACTNVKISPVTWEDIANTIPSNPDYLLSVNGDVIADTIVNNVWGKDVSSLIEKGLALDSILPEHVVVVQYSGALYVTWPLTDPRSVNAKVQDWPTASLNNTVDGYIVTQGNASLVLSSTQAWVVNNVHGEMYVNNLLSAAMNTKAVHVQPYAQCIASTPNFLSGVVYDNNRYYVVQLNRDPGQWRIDVDAFGKNNGRKDILDGLGRLPYSEIHKVSHTTPFVAIAFDKGAMPRYLEALARLSGKEKIVDETEATAPYLQNVSGTVVARWDEGEIAIQIPYTSIDAARQAADYIRKVVDENDYGLKVKSAGKDLIVSSKFTYALPPLNDDSHTPHAHTQTDNPSAIGYARFDPDGDLPVQVYAELAPEHGRFQVDYTDGPQNASRAFQFIKSLVLRIL